MSAAGHQVALRIAAGHPSLPGHFPGRPLVPGVVLLDQVLAAVEDWLGPLPVPATLPQVKFVQPLLPEQDAVIVLTREGTRLRFAIRRDDTTIASGELALPA